jgi:2-amino-4-hydroxy-6-hydroxymethyldihydropteridine diphosphokinase
MNQTLFIGLGSNLGDRLENIRRAVESIHHRFCKVEACSPIYETPPWGVVSQPLFMNAVIKGSTDLSATETLAAISSIQRDFGPPPSQRYGPRYMDLDIIFYGTSVLHTPDLIVPHPQAHRRWFVLQPLADICPDFVHPVWKISVADLLALVVRHSPGEVGTISAFCLPSADSWSVVPISSVPAAPK